MSNTNDSLWNLGKPNITGKEEEYAQARRIFIYSIVFVCLTLFVGIAFREWLKKVHFPYTAFLFLFGVVMGTLDHHIHDFHIFTGLAKFDSRLLMHIFLPAIIYESAFSMEPHMFFMALTQCLILAIPGLLICSLLTGAFAKYIFQSYNWSWNVCFIFGTILSATDPVAVVALLKECGISPSLTTIIEGESLLNDGIAIVLFDSLLSTLESGNFHVSEILYEFAYNGGVSVAVAYVICVGTIALLRRIELDTDIEVTFTFCIAYLTYYLNEITLDASGVLSVVVLGVCMSNYKSSVNYEEEGESTVLQFWQTLSFWANTLIFTIVGIIIASRNKYLLDPTDIGFALAAYVAVSAFRTFMVWLFSGLLKRTGYGFSWNYAVVLTWSGLRGAVGLALVLIAQYSIAPTVADQLLKQVSAIIFLTLVVNAPTMNILLKLLGVGQVTDKNIKCMNRAISMLRDSVSSTERVIRNDKYLLGVDWMWVRQITYFQNPYEKVRTKVINIHATVDMDRGHCHNCKAEIKVALTQEEILAVEEESRIRILQSLGSSVWHQHSQYRISRRTLQHLNTSIENAMDEKGKYVLSDELIKKYLIIGKFTRFLRRIMMGITEEFSIGPRQSKMNLFLRNSSTSGFQNWCLQTYLSKCMEVMLYWVLLLNVIPIAGEVITIFVKRKHKNVCDKEVIIFEAFNALMALFYVFDAIVAIGALGCREYFRRHGRKIDFAITSVAVIQTIIAIVLISAYFDDCPTGIVYALVIMGSLRLIRLFRITLSGMVSNIMDAICSTIYDAYDLAMGFTSANIEIVETASKILHYEPSVDFAHFTAENNILQMMSYMDNMDSEFPDVTNAWTTQKATVYVLRDMKFVVQQMLNIYMIDETDAELLLEELSQKTKDTFCGPRFMPASKGLRNLFMNVSWVKNDAMVDLLLSNSSINVNSEGDIIQKMGTKHEDVRIIYTGIVQVMGRNDGEQHSVLPNTDSLEYFSRTGPFCDYLISPEALGVMGYLQGTSSATSATCTKDSELVRVSYESIKMAEEKFGDLSFEMWRPIALKIATDILKNLENFEYWTTERIKIYLEGGIFPCLQETDHFEVTDQAITDMVLVQGRILDEDTDDEYTGPCYIPSTVRNITIRHNLDRSRVILILLRKERYHSRTIMGWIKPGDINLKGLCLVHGIRRTSKITDEEMKEAFTSRNRGSVFEILGNFFSKDKTEKMLDSDEP